MRTPLWIPVTGMLTFGCGAAGFWQGKAERREAVAESRLEEHSMKPADAPLPEAAAPAENTEAFARRLERAEVAALSGLYEELRQFAQGEDRQTRLELLVARWAELDPAGGLVFFRENDAGDARACLLLEWALLDTDAAILALAAEGEAGRKMAAETGAALLPEDAEVFWKWFRHWRTPLPEQGTSSANWKAVARSHGAELEEVAREMWRENERAKSQGDASQTPPVGALYALLAAVKAETDPAAAVAWAEQTPEPVRGAALKEALTALGRTDPEAALARLEVLLDQETSPRTSTSGGMTEVLKNTVLSLADQDIGSAMRWMDKPERGLSLRMELGHRLGLAMADGRIPVTEAVKLMRENGLAHGVSVQSPWLALSPEQSREAASGLLAQIDAEPENGQLLSGLLADWWQHDAAGAAAFAATMDGELQQEAYARLMNRNRMGNTDSGRMQRALLSVPEEHRAQTVSAYFNDMSQGAYELTTSSPLSDLGGYSAILDDLPNSPERDAAAIALARKWSLVDPRETLAWVRSQENPELRAEATGQAVLSWAGVDAWGASQQVRQMPAGPEKDAAARGLALEVVKHEPDSAWAWAESIAEPERRLQTQMQLLGDWRKTDPAGARAAVEREASRLSGADRARLLQSLEN